ncbi:RIP metalloprotease RseP [bacterium]|nr:RIP metalloprotease RseP [bacterium]
MLLTLISFLFVLSFLVVIHEFGHFAVAKLSGIGVERFSVGMPPRVLGVQIGETDYCISAIPFGGYVKLTGQSDFDEVESEDYGDRDYRKKSVPVRMAVLVAGSIMNLLAALVIFFFVYWMTGVPQSTNRVGLVEDGTLAAQLGFKRGDEIVAVQGKKTDNFDSLIALYTDDNVTLTVRDENGDRQILVPRKLKENEDFGISAYYDARIGSILPDSPAQKAGIRPDDVIVAIDNEPVYGWEHMRKIIEANPDAEKTFTIRRNGETIQLPVKIGHSGEGRHHHSKVPVGRVGYTPYIPNRDVGLVESGRMAVDNTVFLITHTVDFFIKLITGRMSAKLLGGPVMIAQLAGRSAQSGFVSLLGFTAFISVNLGVLNLLPFPVLDGGHVTILFIETVVRRKLSTRARMAFQQFGSLVLLIFMLYVTFNDIMRVDTIARLFGGN